jgi:hypothetical protein
LHCANIIIPIYFSEFAYKAEFRRQGVELGPYIVGGVLALVTAAIAVAFWEGSLGRRRRSPHDLAGIRTDIERLTTTSTTLARRLTVIGENVVTVLRDINTKLLELDRRGAELTERADKQDQLLSAFGPQLTAIRETLAHSEAHFLDLRERLDLTARVVEQFPSHLQETTDRLTGQSREIRQLLENTQHDLAEAQRRTDDELRGLNSRVQEATGLTRELNDKIDIVQAASATQTSNLKELADQTKQLAQHVSLYADRFTILESMLKDIEARIAARVPPPQNPPEPVRIAPKDRGGGPRGSRDPPSNPGQKPLSHKPQLVAQRNGAGWNIFVEVEADTTELTGYKVIQGHGLSNETPPCDDRHHAL